MAARVVRAVSLLGLLGLATACAMLPASGPTASDVVVQSQADPALGGYVLLDIDERIASISASQPRESFRRVFSDVGPAPDLRIGVSDSVVVTVEHQTQTGPGQWQDATIGTDVADNLENDILERARQIHIARLRALQ